LPLSRRWAALGAISYPLYLMHSGAGFIIGAHLFFHPADSVHFPPIPTFFLMLFMALAASTLAAFLFDAPLQRLARRVM